MKEVTQWMINSFDLENKGYDFMGYIFSKPNQLSFHHLIIPKRECPQAGLGDGYILWNGAILKQLTSHDYLHLIEQMDKDTFWKITKQMIIENRKGNLDLQQLKQIRYFLEIFEKIHKNDTTKEGKKLIKTMYTTDRIPL